MTDTYARLMRATDGPGDGRATRSRAPRRSRAVSASAAGTPAVTEINGSASGVPTAAAAAVPTAAAAAVPTAAAAAAVAADSPAEAMFTAAAAAFMAGWDAQRRRDLVFEDVPAPKRLAPYATAI